MIVSLNSLTSSKRALISCLALMAVLAIGLGTMLWLVWHPSPSVANFRERFEQLRSLEAKWNNEILSLQLGISSSYDAVTHASRDLRLGLSQLESNVDGDLVSITPILKDYVDAVEEKNRLSEQVKASYAMLRNSATVLPATISDLFQNPDAHAYTSALDQRPVDLVTEAMTSMVSFVISPSTLLRDTAQQEMNALRAARNAMQQSLAEEADRFLAQVEVVIRERQRGNELMLALDNIHTDKHANRIQNEIQTLLSRNANFQSRLWIYTLLFATLLALTLSYFFFLQWRRLIELNRDNRMLHQKNQDAEQQLLQSAKLSALGQMVAGITHEINTPLAYVKAVFELIKERIGVSYDLPEHGREESDAERAREELNILLEDGLHGLEEIATLVRTMKNFSRLDKGQIESFLVEEGIENALLIARPQLKYVADVKLEFDSVPPLMGSPSQLRQVLLNLIVNACQAMATTERRGLLTLRTRLTSSDMIQIDVCDNGPGIPDEILNKIFDPFFTTKPVGEGTGMGLSICYRIVENHGGTITVNSKPGKGTIFTVTLPRQDEKFPEHQTNTLKPDHIAHAEELSRLH